MKALDSAFFSANRQLVMEQLKGSLLVVPAYAEMQRGNDTAFRFEQEANFWYLTGIEYPNWWVIIDGSRGRSWLVAPTVDKVHALFDGSLSHERASEISGIHEVLDHREGLDLLRQAARKHQFAYTVDALPHHNYFNFTLNPSAHTVRELLARTFKNVQDFRGKLAELRAIKRPEEIAAIQSAIDITIEGFEYVKKTLSSYKYEYEVEAEFGYLFRKSGVDHAYDPIVAGGLNACTLHYIANADKLQAKQLLLMDVGARRNGYAADITRTYAYKGSTVRQRAIYEAVERAHKAIVGLLTPYLTVDEYHSRVDDIMKIELYALGLIKNTDDEEGYRRHFPHAISHGLGIDIHDSLGQPQVFRPGMVVMVEPGMYSPEEKIGARIEDAILITETGHRNMSGKLSTAL